MKPVAWAVRTPPPAPAWRSAVTLVAQGLGMFALPFVVGFVAALVFEAAEVADTSTAMVGFTLVVLFPVAFAQVLGVIAKSWSDLSWYGQRESLGAARLLDVLATHARVVTPRGWALLVSGVALVVLAIAAKWAVFGLMAVLALFLFYGVTGWTVLASTFLGQAFERGVNRRDGITRRMVPAVAEAGDPVEEAFAFRGVPIPWGYVLVVEDVLPERLRTESRYVVGSAARGVCEARGRLRATPRGHWFVGPARLWYQDILGITRVSVASLANAELKVLPRIPKVEIIEPPATPRVTPDVLTRPHRVPTDDHFRFREYAAGDDTRRIHWRLSLRSGHLQVRQPETREINAHEVLLVLDAWLPVHLVDAAAEADLVLDGLVEAWLGAAKELVERGERVTLVAAATHHDSGEIGLEIVRCRPGEAARWQDLGARARWQAEWDVPDLLRECGERCHGVVVSGRFAAAPPERFPGRSTTWLFLDPTDVLGPTSPDWLGELIGGRSLADVLTWLVRLPHPVGSDDNAIGRRIRHTLARRRRHGSRERLRMTAAARAGRTIAELQARGDSVYRIEPAAGHLRLIGLRA